MRRILHVTSIASDTRRLVYESRANWSIVTPAMPQRSLELLQSESFDFVLFDIAVTGVWIPDLIAAIASIPSHPPLFILSREYTFGFLQFSRDIGTCGYFHIPYDFRALKERIDRFFQMRAIPTPAKNGSIDRLADEILGKSDAMKRLRAEIVSLRNKKEPVLIRGETGSGKDLVARLLHRHSPVSAGAYTVSNVSCLPGALAESLLFGTVRGSFTDSVDAPGLFEQADGGTLFLDEIGELELSLQPKLLRVIEDRKVARLGSARKKTVDFRLICATNRNLEEMVAQGTFRADLYYRIDVIRLEIPPLRAHPEDIPVLAASWLSGKSKILSSNALDKLHGYRWPGNVRQLYGCLSRAALACDGEVIYPDQIRF